MWWLQVSCDKKTTEIVLFAKKITVNLDKVAVELLNTDGSKSEMKIAKRQYQQINELLVIVLEDELLVGNTYEIYIQFENIPMEVEEPIGYYSMKYGGYYNNREKWVLFRFLIGQLQTNRMDKLHLQDAIEVWGVFCIWYIYVYVLWCQFSFTLPTKLDMR